MINLFNAEAVEAINSAIRTQLEAGGVGKVTCKTVADEVGLDAEDGHIAVSLVLRHGGAPGFETRKKLGIVPEGWVTASSAKAAEQAAKAEEKAAAAAAKAAKAQERAEKAAAKAAKAAPAPAAEAV
jgi:hypothetical protein